MTWFPLAIFAYFLLAFESVANKFLITGKVKSWRLYLFYIGILSLASLLLAPFGLEWYGWRPFLWSFVSGVIFFGYLAFLFSSLKGSAASRVFVLVGAVSTFVTLVLSHLFLGDRFTYMEIVGICLLVFGGFLISFKFYKKRLFRNWKKVILAGFLISISWVILKHAFEEQNFVSGYIYGRFGITSMTLVMLAIPSYRKKVFSLLKKKDSKKHASNFGAIVGIKTLGGIATALINYTISLGSVAIISALASVQYLFVFILSIIIGFFFREALKENLEKTTVLMKALGVAMVVLGVIFVTLKP